MKVARPSSNQPLPEGAKKVFSGILFDVYQWEQKQFDGTVRTFEKLKRNDTVGVIAVTKDRNIILTRQQQPGMKPFIGTPGGIVDDGEEPFDAAERELLEETGYKSNRWELYESVQPTTKIDWAVFIFIARDCEKITEPRLDSGEKVETIEVSFEQFLDVIKKKEFRDKELVLNIYRLTAQSNGISELKKKLIG